MTFLAVILAVMSLPMTALAGGGPAVITLTNLLTFEPQVLTVRAGQTVEWRNGSLLVHTVTADPALAANTKDVALPAGAKPFNSGDLKPGAVFRHTFRVPGRYRYFCIPHEGAGMIGNIVVTGPPAKGK
ncbi:MAG: cupredoxin domain-containing protein [Gammaproteobacteria bacterium]|nr:plastocyanin/azurin family copper-binding protein [Gammaproteobacteria bacterium]